MSRAHLITSPDVGLLGQLEQEVFSVLRDQAVAAGYELQDGAILGRNALTGETAYHRGRTLRWSEIIETEDDEFAIADPREVVVVDEAFLRGARLREVNPKGEVDVNGVSAGESVVRSPDRR